MGPMLGVEESIFIRKCCLVSYNDPTNNGSEENSNQFAERNIPQTPNHHVFTIGNPFHICDKWSTRGVFQGFVRIFLDWRKKWQDVYNLDDGLDGLGMMVLFL